jgi:hypothetical protein
MRISPPGARQVVAAPANAMEFEEWGKELALPSLLLLGASGSGKTDGIKKLAMAGFKLAVIEIEPKMFGLQKYKPLRLRICKPVKVGNGYRLPTYTERYDRLMRHLDGLRVGKYRVTPDGKPVDLLAYDGLTEAADIIHARKKGSKIKGDLDSWMATGLATIDLFKDLRDAAGVASDEMGLPPVGIVATCGESSPKRLDIKGKTSYIERDKPVLPGNMALDRLPFVFEVIWRLSGGEDDGGAHEWRVHTQLGDTYFAKSPGGIFEPETVVGPGGVDENGAARTPDIGSMYKQMLTDEKSP